MNRSRRLSLALLAVLCLMFVSCRTSPIYNVNHAPVIQGTEKKLSAGQVEDSIKAAGAGLGWQMETIRPGVIQGTLHLRAHMAQVEIPFDESNYSILYKDSVNLKYDGAKIHSQYDTWVKNLELAINKQLGDRLK